VRRCGLASGCDRDLGLGFGLGWQPLAPVPYSAEAVLHDLVETAPHMLPLAGSPRLTVLGREVRLGAAAVPATGPAERCGCDHPWTGQYGRSRTSSSMRWDTKPDNRIRRTSSHPAPTRFEELLADGLAPCRGKLRRST
jgi:hypothetical protein